ncbi:GntR family transcriptional regulator [Pullulanibacillus sp. KACC 23026]|uniref:GntR family transcriptional regulator n=1 Tax=Pullulanibacillus sp. KACC 23026 TaxID=3028315 RepID=UPI0023AFD7C3|nr:GntR family transcriptional regulator [Pullulanibacillus sp. KACC 23026]WEG11105.1 GntR family transcriptional regulator [Pullulanibacillus sp. KACC 23026]
MLTSPTIRGRGTTREIIYQTIKQQILSLELKPGTKISEKEVAAALEVSRTPVRESFLKLAQEELLEIYPQSGTIVSLIDLNHVEEDRFIRESIERSVVRLACEAFSEEIAMESNLIMQDLCVEKKDFSRLFDLDEQFHRLLFEGCQKQRTWEFLHQSNNHLNRLRLLRVYSSLDWTDIISKHKEIFKFIKEKQPEKAEAAMSDHLRLALIEKEVLKERHPNFFK